MNKEIEKNAALLMEAEAETLIEEEVEIKEENNLVDDQPVEEQVEASKKKDSKAKEEERDGPVQRDQPKPKKPARRSKKTVEEPAQEPEAAVKPQEDIPDPSYSKRRIISLSGQKRVVTELDRYNAAHLDLVQSAKAGQILTAIVEGVESYGSNLIAAVLHHGPFKVVIPSEKFADSYPEYRPEMGYKSRQDMIKIMLGKRIGSEVDFLVRGEVNTEDDIAMASRVDAMKRIRNARYLKRDPQGNRYMYAGAIAEARVQVVARSGIIVEIQGAETFVPLEELSYTRCRDAGELFSVGELKPAKILEININEETNEVDIKVSLKAAEENPIKRMLPQLQKGGMYGGSVTVITVYGVFIQLDNGCEVLCKYPSFGNAPVAGSRAVVKLTSIDEKKMRIMGTISSIQLPR